MRQIAMSLTLFTACGFANQVARAASPPRDLYSDTWAATDALNRTLPDASSAPAPKKDRTVAIFYFTWMENPTRKDAEYRSEEKVWDISKILKGNPREPKWGPPNTFHWWAEPQFGYYSSDDPWVIRRHAQMLTDAGVDVIVIDATNSFIYGPTVLQIIKVYEEMRAQHERTPQIAFITHSAAEQTVQKLYDLLYAKNIGKDLWFQWGGKPLILTDEAGLHGKLAKFFTVRKSWAWSDPNGWFGDGKDAWPWLDNSPQRAGWHESPDQPEAIAVGVAQHPTTNIGRSHQAGKQPPPSAQEPDKGIYFAEQWNRALEVDPQFVFVTGWNEWIAQRFISAKDAKGHKQSFAGRTLEEGDSFFVDEYTREYSRDIEPMKGGHSDNYYYQLAANVRKYKGVRPAPIASASESIDYDGDIKQWTDVGPEYRDHVFDTLPRKHPGYADAGMLTNTSGRNDFITMKVAHTADTFCFLAQARDPFIFGAGEDRPMLLIDIDSNCKTGWEGYDLLIDRRHCGTDCASVEQNVGGKWEWKDLGSARIEGSGRDLQIWLDRKDLGFEGKPANFEFKWIDHVPPDGNIAHFMDQGDVAPNGRFNYRYREE